MVESHELCRLPALARDAPGRIAQNQDTETHLATVYDRLLRAMGSQAGSEHVIEEHGLAPFRRTCCRQGNVSIDAVTDFKV